MKKGYRMIWIISAAAILAALTIWIIWANKAPVLTVHRLSFPSLPDELEGYRIAQISDLHNDEMGEKNKRLLSLLHKSKPNLIAITGDMIDSRRTNLSVSLDFAQEALRIAPCYYVPGNHESRIEAYPEFRQELKTLGVSVLEDTSISFDCNLTLLGLRDPTFHEDFLAATNADIIRSVLDSLDVPANTFTLLLSHRPEHISTYAEYPIDLVLCGHAHGGQFRIPCIGGVLAPNQGYFPKYDSGCYLVNNTTMVVSRGIGNSAFPFRLNNRPEIILVELRQEKSE